MTFLKQGTKYTKSTLPSNPGDPLLCKRTLLDKWVHVKVFFLNLYIFRALWRLILCTQTGHSVPRGYKMLCPQWHAFKSEFIKINVLNRVEQYNFKCVDIPAAPSGNAMNLLSYTYIKSLILPLLGLSRGVMVRVLEFVSLSTTLELRWGCCGNGKNLAFRVSGYEPLDEDILLLSFLVCFLSKIFSSSFFFILFSLKRIFIWQKTLYFMYIYLLIYNVHRPLF